MSTESKGRSERKGKVRPIIWFAAMLVALGVGLAMWGWHQYTVANPTDFGTFMGGVVGPLWSLAGLLVIYAAFVSQGDQLRLQDEEVKQAAQAAREQQFESHFFALLQLHNNILSDLRAGPPRGTPYEGREAIRFLLQEMVGVLATLRAEDPQMPPMRAIVKTYRGLYEGYQAQVGHYFRNLYHVIRFVDRSGPPERKKEYTSLVRAQLSSNELGLLFYNVLAAPVYSEGENKFMPLVERYALFENMDLRVIREKSDLRLYADASYGDRAAEVHRLLTDVGHTPE